MKIIRKKYLNKIIYVKMQINQEITFRNIFPILSYFCKTCFYMKITLLIYVIREHLIKIIYAEL